MNFKDVSGSIILLIARLAIGVAVFLPALAMAAVDGAMNGTGAGAGMEPGNQVDTAELAKQLAGLFVVATVLESALTTLFNWRVYREFFNGRAFKTLIMVAAGYAVVELFRYDVVSTIISNAGGMGSEAPALSKFLSALVLAGGSAAVNQLFRALGLRPPVEEDEPRKLPPEKKAWVSVRIIRDKAVGDVRIGWDVIANPSDAQKTIPATAGIVAQHRGFWGRLWRLFFADPTRFPSYGGRTVDTDGKIYRIVATARLQDSETPREHEIYVGPFADRAIVDFVKVI